MDLPSEGYFVNPRIKPSESDLLRVMGTAGQHWSLLVHFLKYSRRLKGSYRFYTTEQLNGWAVEFGRARKVKVTLVPDKNSFKVSLGKPDGSYLLVNDSDDPRDLLLLLDKSFK